MQNFVRFHFKFFVSMDINTWTRCVYQLTWGECECFEFDHSESNPLVCGCCVCHRNFLMIVGPHYFNWVLAIMALLTIETVAKVSCLLHRMSSQ